MDFFKEIKNKRTLLVFVLVGMFIYAGFMMVVFILLKETGSPPPTISGDISGDYSSLNKVVPGKNTQDEVEKINGKPESVSTKDDKTYMQYKTPLENFINTVVLKDGRVVYSEENVFGPYRGSVSDFKDKYGTPDISLFENNYPWSVYLGRGIAFQHDGKDVLKILYFIPQDKETFMRTLAQELGLSVTPIPDE
ncbi:MAG: hypothetical protein HY426_00285 [Candidatus Levybacteria bacterium]|nr:hypothetical protein [Candidatus Levybacteria bacterium]